MLVYFLNSEKSINQSTVLLNKTIVDTSSIYSLHLLFYHASLLDVYANKLSLKD